MLAIGMVRGKSSVQEFQIPEPEIKEHDEVLIRIKEVGLDGTDYNIVRHGIDMANDRNEMVMGHEAVGVVVEVGSSVKSIVPGDVVSVTVRRGCGICHPCLHNKSDMCMTGLFTERGIHKVDGFLSQFVVDKEQYVLKVPPGLMKMAVLTEPVSIAGKAIEQIRIIQSRLPWTCQHPEHDFLSPEWGGCRTALVVGAGPLGILNATLLRLAKVNTIVADIVPDDHPKASLVNYIGAKYVDTRTRTPKQVMEYCEVNGGQVNMIVEASGAAATALELINYMARSSIYVMTGIPSEGLRLNVDAGQIVRQMVRFNQVIVGSVNSNRTHFENALKEMERMKSQYPELHNKIITNRISLDEYEKAFEPKWSEHVKTVIQLEPWK